MNLTKVDIEILRNTHRSRGIQLMTPSGPLSGGDGSELSLVTALLDECERSLAKDAEIASIRAQLDEALAQVAMLSSPVAVHANMLRGTIAMPSLTNFLHAMGNHALVAIRETVAIAERNEKSKYVERARHLLNIDGGPPENLVDEARRKAIEDAANTAEQHSRLDVRCKCGFEIAEDIRALLSESKS